MRWRRCWFSLVLPLLMATSMAVSSAPAQAAHVAPPLAGKVHDLSHPVYHVSTFLGLTTPTSAGKHPAAGFPNAWCRNDTAYFLPFVGIGRWYGYSLSQRDQFVSAQLWYLWCPATDSRAAPYGFNFSGGRIASVDGQCHAIGLGVPMNAPYTDLAGVTHNVDSYAGATLLVSGASSTTSADPRSARTVCPWRPLTTWSGVADGRYTYMAMLNVLVELSPNSGTGFMMHAPLFE